MAKVRDILYSTRSHARLMNSESGPLLLLGPLILDEANFERFRLIFRNLDDGDDYDFEHFEEAREAHESLKAALEGMNQYWSAFDPQSEAFSLLMEYVAVADSYREDMLTIFAGYLNFHLQSLNQTEPPLVLPRRALVPVGGFTGTSSLMPPRRLPPGRSAGQIRVRLSSSGRRIAPTRSKWKR